MATDSLSCVNNFHDHLETQENTPNDAASQRIELASRELDSFCLQSYNHVSWNFVSDLDLAFNNLSDLPNEFSVRLSNLQTLDLSGNVLNTLPEVLGELTCLTSLKANESCIHDLPNSFSNLTKLKYLSLVGNTLSKFDNKFCFPENLETLLLDESEMKFLPDSICHLHHLKVLEASNNSLVELPVNFGEMCDLQVINLSHNNIETLPDSLAILKNLTVIDISHNKLIALTTSLASTERLKTFHAGHNRLEGLPQWTSKLKSIETYSVKDNVLLGRPFEDEFCESAKETLITFDLAGNFIEYLPSNLGILSKVEFLHVGSIIPELERSNFQNGNWIMNLPENVGEMVSLTKLRLDENQFDRLPDSFGNLVNLEFLDLGQNRLRHLPDSFCNLKSLKSCFLSKNCLVELPQDFGKLNQLIELLLDSNQLRELPTSLCKLTNLVNLDLFDNHLSHIPDCLQFFKQLKALNIDWNDFDVDDLEVPQISQANYYSEDRKRFGPGSAKDADGASALAAALRNKRALWASHGETRERQGMQRHDNDLVENGISSLSLNDAEEPTEVSAATNGYLQNGHLNELEEEEDWDKDLEDVSPYGDIDIYQHPVTRNVPRGTPAVDFYFLPSEEHAQETAATVFHTDVQDGQFDDAD
ncbi:hypothetical protein BSL78_01345 [Apostichopus japonicus]|uniref:Uncharacterized protein n=1 Tax=Stichopus japonicus TaxID=307972 RepID=A0A2G8LNA4_STIJA|nr:hypothetical protein BSL78_01345 [Apostichopus japonicus]